MSFVKEHGIGWGRWPANTSSSYIFCAGGLITSTFFRVAAWRAVAAQPLMRLAREFGARIWKTPIPAPLQPRSLIYRFLHPASILKGRFIVSGELGSNAGKKGLAGRTRAPPPTPQDAGAPDLPTTSICGAQFAFTPLSDRTCARGAYPVRPRPQLIARHLRPPGAAVTGRRHIFYVSFRSALQPVARAWGRFMAGPISSRNLSV